MDLKRLIRHYFLADFFASVSTWMLFCLFRGVANDVLVFRDIPIFTPSFNFGISITFYPICCLFFNYITGFYDVTATRSRVAEFFATLASSFMASFISFFVILLDDVVVSYRFYYQSFLVLWTLQFCIMYLLRVCITYSYFHKIRTNKIRFNMIIVGTGQIAKKTEEHFRNKLRFYGSHFIGFIQVNKKVNAVGTILGNLNQVEAIIKKHDIKMAIVAMDDVNEHQTFSVINQLIRYDIEINTVPRESEILTGRVGMEDIDSIPLIRIFSFSMPAWQRSVKRVFDISASLLGLILFSPVLLYLSLRIKLDSEGAVFYFQERIGKNGIPFKIIKFRSMYLHSESGLPRLTEENDSRITPFGKILRKYRLDELPQLFNILKGEMSFVGPRPERNYFIQQIMKEAPYYCLLYKIQPGLLSWGPIKVGYTHTIEEMKQRLNYDIIYMDNMSLFTDIKIILYSFEVIFKGKGV